MAETNTPAFKLELPDDSLWPQGRYVYQRNCQVCHGAYGDGRGEMAKDLKPAPRNFGRGIFKYRSTPTGKLPTDEDLGRTIRGGVSGTSMPMFGFLSNREVKSVIEYIKSLSSRWRHADSYAPAIAFPPLPEWFADDSKAAQRADSGRVLFNASCANCHGVEGDGNGIAAKDLEDTWGHPCPPPDLRIEKLRSGPGLEDVYKALTTGIDGSPMPSFAESLSTEQRWDVVAFIGQLRRRQIKSESP